ncbi:hypothetical protein D3C78_961230 [compost metagenome]
MWQCVTDRIGQIDNRSAFLNNSFNHFNQIIDSCSRSIHRREFNDIRELTRISRHLAGFGYDFSSAHTQLMLQMNIRRGDEQVNPPAFSILGCPDCRVNIPFNRPCKTANFHISHLTRNRLYCCKITRARYRKSRLHHINTQIRKLIGQQYFLLWG